MITYTCNKCGAELDSPPELAGLEDKCPLCGQGCIVPKSKSWLPVTLGVLGGFMVLSTVVGVIVALIRTGEPKPEKPAVRVVAEAPTRDPGTEQTQRLAIDRSRELDSLAKARKLAQGTGEDLVAVLQSYQSHMRAFPRGDNTAKSVEEDLARRITPQVIADY